MNKFIEILKTIKFKIINGMFFRRKNKIILDKNNNYNNITVEFSNMLIKSINHKHIEEMSEHIKEFLNVMTRDCRNFASEILLQNFKITFFDISKIKKIDKGDGGEVNASMSFYPFLGIHKIKNIKYTIDNFSVSKHELLHLCTIKENKCGFKYTYPNGEKFAEGINEGYTQLLAEHYFGENIGSYFYETNFCYILEKIIGKDKMEKSYFDISLPSLIGELEQYENNENIIKFIKDMDLLLNLKLSNHPNPTIENMNECQNIVNELCKFLLSIFKSKVDIVLSELSSVEQKNSLHQLANEIFISHFYIKFLNKEIDEYIINLFDKTVVQELHKYIDEKYYYYYNSNITKNSIK